MGATSSTSSTPNSTASAVAANNLLSPSQVHLPTRKRSHAEHISFIESENKYRRTSPSPHITRSTTPSTSSGQDFTITADGFLDLTVYAHSRSAYPLPNQVLTYSCRDDDTANRELAAKVRQRQREAEEKANREQADAELARLLQEDISGNSISSNSFYPAQSSAPSVFDRMLGLPRLNSEAAHSGTPGVSGVSSTASGFNQAMVSSLPVIKTDQDRLGHATMPGTFQESDSDSDIEFISSYAFNPNGRQTSFGGAQLHNNAPSNLSVAGSVYGLGGVYANPDPQAHTQFSPASVISRMQQQQGHQLYAAYMAQKQRELLASHGQPSAMSVHAAATNGGFALPLPTGMMQQHPSFSSHSEQSGASGMSMFLNSPSFGIVPGSAGPSGLRSILNQDPISKMNHQSSGYNNLTPMDDHQGNPISPVDLRMSQLSNVLGNRLSEIDDYVHDPRRTAQEIQDLLENIRPDVEIPKDNREGTPDGLKYALYEHQKLALTWLKQMEEGTNKGGILADDMGLGKTISALALILSRPSADRRRKVCKAFLQCYAS